MHTRRHTFRAMATAFEFLLCGDDAEHLDAVAANAGEELARVERLLSRFDPASEVSRLNREAATRAVQVDVELFGILRECAVWYKRTEGYFDVTVASPLKERSGIESDKGGTPRATRWAWSHGTVDNHALPAGQGVPPCNITLDDKHRTVRFANADKRLDFGGYGKGYALDCIARIVKQFGVMSAVLHGGTSSVLTIGQHPKAEGWPIGLRDPWDDSRELLQFRLTDRGLSSSAALTRVGEASDIVVPPTGLPLVDQNGCAIVAPDATTAEVFSTALLAMGKARAMEYIGRHCPLLADVSIGWIELRDNHGDCQWLTPLR